MRVHNEIALRGCEKTNCLHFSYPHCHCAAKFDYSSDPKGIKIEKSINNREYTIRDMSGNKTLITFDKGNEVKLLSGNNGVRFLLVSGNPIQEPVAWHGPIVMNTNEEIEQAITELNNGTFIRQ